MAVITATLVKELRDLTGLGMMDCKKALVDSEGDMKQAIEILRTASGLKAAKKAGRTASDGLVAVAITASGDAALVIEVNCETDFAARQEDFRGFVDKVVGRAMQSGKEGIEDLLASGLEQERQALIQKIGENVAVRRLSRMETGGDGFIVDYVHNGKIAVLVSLRGGDRQLGRDIAMHIAAANPLVVRPEDVDADTLATEHRIYVAQAAESGKPAAIVEKMVAGRMKKFLAEVSLVEQAFVKDPDRTIGSLLQSSGATVQAFVRFELGEGIEVEETDFAAEVAATTKKA